MMKKNFIIRGLESNKYGIHCHTNRRHCTDEMAQPITYIWF